MMLTLAPVADGVPLLKNDNEQTEQGDFALALRNLLGLAPPPSIDDTAAIEPLNDAPAEKEEPPFPELSVLQPTIALEPAQLQQLVIQANDAPAPMPLATNSLLTQPALPAANPLAVAIDTAIKSSTAANEGPPAASSLASLRIMQSEEAQVWPEHKEIEAAQKPESNPAAARPDVPLDELTVVTAGRGGERDAAPLPTSGLFMDSTSTVRAATVETPAANTFTLGPQVGTSAWQQSLGQQLTIFTRDGVHNAELRLNPAELGALKIHLQVKNDAANLHVVAENQQVRSALEAALPFLKNSLAESGLQLSMSSSDSGSAHSWNESNRSGESEVELVVNDEHEGSAQEAEEFIDLRADPMQLNMGINTFV